MRLVKLSAPVLLAAIACSSPPEGMDVELAVDCPAVHHPAQVIDALAWNGTDYLAAWTRAGGHGRNIVVERVTSGGEVRDPYGIAVTSSYVDESAARLAAAGDGEVLVGFAEQQTLTGDGPLLVARLSPDGAVLDRVGVAAAEGLQLAALDWTGDSWLMVWVASPPSDIGPYELRAAHLSRDLEIVEPGGVLLASTSRSPSQVAVAVANDGSDVLVAWADLTDTFAVDLVGVQLDATTLSPSAPITVASDLQTPFGPALVADAAGYLVAWSVPDGLGRNLMMARITSAGELQPPEIGAAALSSQLRPLLARSGDTSLLVYDDGPDSWALRLDANLAPLDPAPIRVTQGSLVNVVAASPAGFLLAGDRTAVRLAVDGTVLDPAGFPLVTTSDRENQPAIAVLGDGPLVAWTEIGGLSPEEAGAMARLGMDGTMRDPVPVRAPARAIVTGGMMGGGLMAWRDGNIRASRLGSDGTVRDAGGIQVSTAAADEDLPAAACAASQCLVAWTVFGVADDLRVPTDVRAARVGSDGAVLDPAGIDIGGMSSAGLGDVTRGEGSYLVTWLAWRDRTIDIVATRVDDDGVVLEPAAVVVAAGLPASGRGSFRPRTAFSDGMYLVIWYQDFALQAIRVDARMGQVIGNTIRIDAADSLGHDATGDGDGFFVVWQKAAELRATRLARDGSLDDLPAPILAVEAIDPALATAPDGWIALAYSRFIPDAPFAANRVRVRFVDKSLWPLADQCGPAD